MISGLICLVVGSVLGGTARYFVSGVVARRFGEAFPWGTLLINVTGAFLIGIFGARATHDVSMLAQPAPWLFRGHRLSRLLHHGVVLQPADADPCA